MGKISDNRVRGVRTSIPTNVVVGRIDKGTGKAQLLDSTSLRRILGPGYVKAIATAVQTLTQNHIYVGNASNIAADVAMSGDATIVASGALTLANTAVTPGTYGDTTHYPIFTVDSKGRLTAASNQTLSASSLTLTQNHIFVGNASNQPADVALSGDATIVASGALTLANTAVTPGSYGSASQVGTFTVDSKGRLTAAANVTISGSGGGSVDPSPFSDDSITKPVAADFTIADDTSTNHGTGAKTDLSTRGVNFKHTQAATPVSSQSLFFKAAVSNTLDTMIAYLQPNLYTSSGSAWFFGIAVRDNAGKIDAFGIRNSSTVGAFVEFQYTTVSSVSSAPGGTAHGVPINNRPIWLKLQKVSTNFVFSASFDGETFFTISTTSATAFVGATLNDVGVFIVNNLAVASAAFSVDCFSFSRT